MVEPEIYEFLDWITELADSHRAGRCCPRSTTSTRRISVWPAHGFWTYDFVLPGLVLHAFRTGEARRLAEHLAGSPARQFTTLDSHDGIPVRPDLDGILAACGDARPGSARPTAGRQRQPDPVGRACGRRRRPPAQLHLLLGAGGDDERYLAARAIQLFARGVPQVYYVGLLAGENDLEAVERTGEGRAINRHDYAAGRDRRSAGAPGGPAAPGAHPAPQHAPGVRWSS